jgi:hypothetical protein
VITLTTPGRVDLQPGSGTDSIAVTSGTFSIAAVATATSPTILPLSSLNISTGAAPDLANNELLVSGSSLSIINGYAKSRPEKLRIATTASTWL